MRRKQFDRTVSLEIEHAMDQQIDAAFRDIQPLAPETSKSRSDFLRMAIAYTLHDLGLWGANQPSPPDTKET
jgi:hypothetical protein